jgi:hypothetical protein
MVEQRTFTGAGRTPKGDEVATTNFEINSAQDFQGAAAHEISLFKAAGRQQ